MNRSTSANTSDIALATKQKIENSDMESLTEGRIVHYVLQLEGLVSTPPEYAAIVSRVYEMPMHQVRLHVFAETTVIVRDYVPYDADKAQGTWHWIGNA